MPKRLRNLIAIFLGIVGAFVWGFAAGSLQAPSWLISLGALIVLVGIAKYLGDFST